MGCGAVGSSEDVACTVVGIGVGGVTCSTEQLTLVVVGVALLLPDLKFIIPSMYGFFKRI